MMLPRIAKNVLKDKLTYLSPAKFHSLYSTLDSVQQKNVAGDFLEFGIALGGSAICLASALDGDRRFHGYDVFDTIPPPSDRDDDDSKTRYDQIQAGKSEGIKGDRYYGYEDDLFLKVSDNFRKFGLSVDGERIVLHKGLFQNTVRFADDDRIALAHIDCDWHDPVAFCLDAVSAKLSAGGFMIIDDYNDYRGCKTATDKFVETNAGFDLIKTEPHAVIRKR